jgi:hypothetical protein
MFCLEVGPYAKSRLSLVLQISKLVSENRVLSTPNPKPGRSLSQTTQDIVVNFYVNDESSRLMPGKKDCVSVKTAEGRETVQKRLIYRKVLYRFVYP